SSLMELAVENVRSFVGRHTVPIYPLTLVVGENSSGKTTLLAALSAVCDASAFPYRPRFNEPPYNLGTFDTIATYKGGSYHRAPTFSLGFQGGAPRHEGVSASAGPEQVYATYANGLGQPELLELHSSSSSSGIHLRIDPGEAARQVHADWTHGGRKRSAS